MSDRTETPELTDEQLLTLMVASEYRNRKRRRGHKLLVYPVPPCALCAANVREQMIGPLSGPLDIDNRLVVNEPCGCRMSYSLAAAERLVGRVQAIVDQKEIRPVSADHGEQDVCRPVEVDGETVRVRGSGDLTEEGQEAVAALVRAAKAKFVAEAPEQVGKLQEKLRLAHSARRVKEHQLDDIRRALCDAGFMEDDDPYAHADLADVIRQAGEDVQGESGRLRERLRLLTDEKVAYVTGPTTDLLCEEIGRLKAEVAAARKFAAEMRDFCSPHGVSVDYADRLLEAMDRAKEAEPGQSGTTRGTVPAEYVRLKAQFEADLKKMAACAAQPPRPGAEEGRATQGGIAAGIRTSLAWAIHHFEGPAAREAFLKRLEGDR